MHYSAATVLQAASSQATHSEVTLMNESLSNALIISIVALLIIVSNSLFIIAIVNITDPKEVINVYLLSLATSDLLAGMLVTIVCVYPAALGRWPYGDWPCHVSSYLMTTLWTTQVFTLMWLSVDRYLATIRPLRYDNGQTKTRCQCWMAVSWLSSCALCTPPLFGFSSPVYDQHAFVCFSDWSVMPGYVVAATALILGPPLITVVYTYVCVFTMSARLKRDEYVRQMDKEFVTAALQNIAGPTIMLSFLLNVVFWLSWLPYIVLKLCEVFEYTDAHVPHVHFAFFWLGMLNSVWKSLACFCSCPIYRQVLSIVCRWLLCCCSYTSPTTLHASY